MNAIFGRLVVKLAAPIAWTGHARLGSRIWHFRTGISSNEDTQRNFAEASEAALDKSRPFKESIVTEITKAGEFYAAEDYHQDYYKKNPVRYRYRYGCGRDARLKELWGKAPE